MIYLAILLTLGFALLGTALKRLMFPKYISPDEYRRQRVGVGIVKEGQRG